MCVCVCHCVCPLGAGTCRVVRLPCSCSKKGVCVCARGAPWPQQLRQGQLRASAPLVRHASFQRLIACRGCPATPRSGASRVLPGSAIARRLEAAPKHPRPMRTEELVCRRRLSPFLKDRAARKNNVSVCVCVCVGRFPLVRACEGVVRAHTGVPCHLGVGNSRCLCVPSFSRPSAVCVKGGKAETSTSARHVWWCLGSAGARRRDAEARVGHSGCHGSTAGSRARWRRARRRRASARRVCSGGPRCSAGAASACAGVPERTALCWGRRIVGLLDVVTHGAASTACERGALWALMWPLLDGMCRKRWVSWHLRLRRHAEAGRSMGSRNGLQRRGPREQVSIGAPRPSRRRKLVFPGNSFTSRNREDLRLAKCRGKRRCSGHLLPPLQPHRRTQKTAAMESVCACK